MVEIASISAFIRRPPTECHIKGSEGSIKRNCNIKGSEGSIKPYVLVNWRCNKRRGVTREEAGARTGFCVVVFQIVI
jgi:hypothetical protein